MLAKLFEVLGQVVTNTLTLIIDVFEGTTAIFYNDTEGFTFVGTLMLVAFGMSIAFFGWKVIKGLIK